MQRSLALALALAALSCRGKERPAPAPTPSGSVPPDRLAPGEPPPGIEKAHGLTLPRGARIERVFGRSIYATVPTSPEDFANYVRGQATEAEGVVGPSGTVFPKVRLKGEAPGHYLRVEIAPGSSNDECSIIVDRIEEVSIPPPNESNDELMRKAGLTPDGKLLNPTKIE